MPQKTKNRQCGKSVLRARAQCACLSTKKEKGILIDAAIQLVGHKSGKRVIREHGSRRNVRERKKTGALTVTDAIQAAVKEILML